MPPSIVPVTPLPLLNLKASLAEPPVRFWKLLKLTWPSLPPFWVVIDQLLARFGPTSVLVPEPPSITTGLVGMGDMIVNVSLPVPALIVVLLTPDQKICSGAR